VSTGRDGQLISGASLPIRLANFVKLPHTIFAMPFALAGVLFASVQHPVDAAMIGWVLLAFTAARFAAMGFNRIIDREFDARNPRTARRELPSGTLTVAQARVSVAIACVLFVIASWQLNTLCLMLSPIALFWILGYSYSKRFTRWSHLWLGLGLSIAPVGGYLAVAGRWSEPWWVICVLALAVVTWSGGFDIIYALQDAEFDRQQGLHSIPSAMGIPASIRLARLLHLVSVLCLVIVAISNPFALSSSGDANRVDAFARAQTTLLVSVVVVAALLVKEHRLVKADDLSKVDAAFFTMNGVISLIYLASVVVARVLVATA
jgi:4-hydroxybenzoate polyprenyltransferase